MENIIAQQLVKMQGKILGKIRESGLQDIGQTAEALFRVVKAETCELLQAGACAAIVKARHSIIETDGNAIVNMTYDALSANFDENPEQLMGTIGAAALRAEDAGYIQALGGDAVLSAMAAEEGDAEVDISMAKDLTKDYLELGIDTLADVHPAFKALSPLLKGLLGVAFDESQPAPMQEIQKKLDEIDHKLDEIEESVKSHADNVVSLSNRGLAFDNITANSKTLRTRMNNIWDPDSGYSQAEKIQQTADLYKTDYTNTCWYYAQGIDAIGYCTGKDEKVQIMKHTEDSATLEKKNSAKDTDYYCSFMFFQAR